MIKVKGTLSPVLVRMNGKLYVTPTEQGWLEVPEGTTLNDIEWVPSFKMVPQVRNNQVTVEHVKSSDGKKVYLVTTYFDGRKTCTCPGWTFRRFCKHTGAK